MGPEEDLLLAVKHKLQTLDVPSWYDGVPHDGDFPQIIVDVNNIQNQPRTVRGVEQSLITISVDVYNEPGRWRSRLQLEDKIRNLMETVRCQNWWSDFSDYSVRTLDDSYEGHSLKRTAFLFDFMTYGVAKKARN